MVIHVFAGRFTRAERVRQRQSVDLDDAALTDATRQRYYSALRKLLPVVESCPSIHQLDDRICLWIHRMWKLGEPLLTIGDALSALHFYEPWTKRNIPHSWKLFSVWRRVEIPCRAPPLTWALVTSLSAYALDHNDLELAGILLLAFHCLLRTGEALGVTFHDLVLGADSGICRLQDTKSGRRNAANEAISITDPTVLEVLRTLKDIRASRALEHLPIWSRSAGQFRAVFQKILVRFGLAEHGFKPYSLRRGGATHLFQCSGSMERALLRGRWQSSRVARVYISDALSYLPKLRMTAITQAMMKKYHL